MRVMRVMRRWLSWGCHVVFHDLLPWRPPDESHDRVESATTFAIQAEPVSGTIASEGPIASSPVEVVEQQEPWRPTQLPLRNSETPALTFNRAFTVCKDMEYPDGNEDFFVWSENRCGAAIFDGATESFAARRWVHLVATAWRQHSQLDFEGLQNEYEKEIDALDLGWAEAQARLRGSFTTLASVSPTSGGLAATIIGDSCIALCRGNDAVEFHPSSDPEFFRSVPEALASSSTLLSANEDLMTACSWTIPIESGEVDRVVLMTDAVGHWVTSEAAPHENSRLASLLACRVEEEWSTLVQEERIARRMKADDSTVVVLDISGER